MSTEAAKSLGQVIDEVVNSLQALEASSRLTAIKAACEHLGIPYGGGATITAPASQDGDHAVFESADTSKQPPQQQLPKDIRSMKEQKTPANNLEMACIVAYYLQYVVPELERKSEVSKDELDKYFVQAGFPKPKRPEQVLVDAKAAGYFESVERGSYKLNAVGYNLVVHALPRSGKSSNRLVARQVARHSSSQKVTKKATRPK